MTTAQKIVVYFFACLFVLIGILNFVLVHPVPGIIYFFGASIYLPATDSFIRNRLGLVIPFFLKLVIAVVVLWGTLGVSDLAEILGF